MAETKEKIELSRFAKRLRLILLAVFLLIVSFMAYARFLSTEEEDVQQQVPQQSGENYYK